MARHNTVSHGLSRNSVQNLAIYTAAAHSPIVETFYLKPPSWESFFLRSFGYVPGIPTVFVRYRTEFTQLIENEGHSIV